MARTWTRWTAHARQRKLSRAGLRGRSVQDGSKPLRPAARRLSARRCTLTQWLPRIGARGTGGATQRGAVWTEQGVQGSSGQGSARSLLLQLLLRALMARTTRPALAGYLADSVSRMRAPRSSLSSTASACGSAAHIPRSGVASSSPRPIDSTETWRRTKGFVPAGRPNKKAAGHAYKAAAQCVGGRLPQVS